MTCPECKSTATSVVDSRRSGDTVRRRRCCDKCRHRFTSYETLVNPAADVEADMGLAAWLENGEIRIRRVTK